MKTKSTLLLAASSMLLLSGCSKKLGQFQADYFSVNPNPLEVVGDRVPATVTARIPEKFFVKNAEVTVTPYLCYEGQETASQPYTFQGEKVRGNNPVVSYDNGGTVTIPVMYLYQPEMMTSDLQLAFNVVQGGKRIIELRGRSSFQSSAYLSVEMIAAAMGGKPFRWPVGVYVNDDRYHHVMMAMETTLDASGVHYRNVEGTKEEQEALDSSYRHLCKLRDEVISMGIIPPVDEWHKVNPHLK